jgi:uncharacterized RDD family membrane protein YckC
MEDYYKLLGVQPDDEREVIRDAYRAKKAELDAAGTEDARSKSSKLNRAWNVLSDDIQRGRYDDQLAEAKADGTVEDVADDAPEAAAGRGRGRGGADRPVRQPIIQETEINGVQLASNKDRGFALAIDGLIVFVLLFVAPLIVAAQLVGDGQLTPYCVQNHPSEDALGCLSELNDAAADQRDVRDDAEDAFDKAEADGVTGDELDQLRRTRDSERAEYDALIDEGEAVADKLQPLQLASFGAGAAIAFLLLFIPSAISGKTLGKAVRRIRLLRDTGEPAGVKASFVRYGVPLGTTVLGTVALAGLGQIVPLVWMFGVTSFARNRRRQGWHDRLAKTIVAAD